MAWKKNMRNNKKNNIKKNNNKKRYNNRRRNPYNAKYKKQTAKILQPIAEGRKFTFLNDSSLVKIVGSSTNDGWQIMIPESWNHMLREQYLETLDKSPTSTGFTGNSIFSRFLNQQVKVKFNQVYHIGVPAEFQVVYGWSKVPYITAEASIGADLQTNSNNVLIEYDPELQIGKNLADMYNKTFPVTDRKQVHLMYNRKFQVAGREVNTPRLTASQVRKDLDYRVTWKPNTKYHMRPCTIGDGNNAMGNPVRPDTGIVALNGPTQPTAFETFWAPSSKKNGDMWIPFFGIRLCNPTDFGKDKDGNADANAYPYLYQKNVHYFYDL
jgi:hypothetical protein